MMEDDDDYFTNIDFYQILDYSIYKLFTFSEKYTIIQSPPSGI